MQQLVVEYQGKQYTAQLDRGETASGKDPAAARLGVWSVTLGPTAVTQFPETPADTAASVQEKVLAWLSAQPDLGDRDQVHLGGG